MKWVHVILAIILLIVPVCGCVNEEVPSITTEAPTSTSPPTTTFPTTTPAPSTTSPPTTIPVTTAPPSTRPPVECTPSWPQLQNTDNRAYSTCEIPLDLQLLWSTQVDIITRNAIIFANGRAYVPGDTSLHCIDAEIGTVLWSYHAASTLKGTPAYCDGQVFLGDKAGILHCIDAVTGDRVWTRQIDENPGGFSSLLVADSKIYVNTGARRAICCIDTETGNIVWEYDAGQKYLGNRTSKMAYANGLLYVPTSEAGVYCMDACTGDVIWHNDSELLRNCRCRPIITENVICVSTIGNVFGLASDSGGIVWSFYTGSPYVPKISSDGTDIYFGIYDGPFAGDLVSLDIRTGELNWQVPIGESLLSGCAPLVTQDFLVVYGRTPNSDEEGGTSYLLYVVDRNDAEIVSTYEGLGGSSAGIAIVNNRIYFCTHDGYAYCLG